MEQLISGSSAHTVESKPKANDKGGLLVFIQKKEQVQQEFAS
jgi:hypothetical protein